MNRCHKPVEKRRRLFEFRLLLFNYIFRVHALYKVELWDVLKRWIGRDVARNGRALLFDTTVQTQTLRSRCEPDWHLILRRITNLRISGKRATYESTPKGSCLYGRTNLQSTPPHVLDNKKKVEAVTRK
jgi:hypothetical protein